MLLLLTYNQILSSTMGKGYEAIHGVLGVLCLVLLVDKIGAYDFVVGGQKGWTVPSNPNFNPYYTWAEKSRFQIGDSLVFSYNSGQDSVLVVKSEDYANCNTDAPIAKYTDGHTVYKLNHSGHHFFISGNKDNCNKNEKLVVVVLADRSNNNKVQAPTPAPSSLASSTNLAPSSPPPASASPPSPPPTATSPPSPPPSATNSSPPAPSPMTGTTPTTPSPAPVSEPPPSNTNGASSVFCIFAGTVGAFMASTLVLSF